MHDPRSIVITGASSGIGAALAQAYAGPGIALALMGRNADRLEHTATACRDAGASVVAAPLDVTDADAMRDWLNDRDRTHPVDLIIAKILAGPHAAMPPIRLSDTAKDGAELSLKIVNETRKIVAVYFSGPDSRVARVDPGKTKTVVLPLGTYKGAARIYDVDYPPMASEQIFAKDAYTLTFTEGPPPPTK